MLRVHGDVDLDPGQGGHRCGDEVALLHRLRRVARPDARGVIEELRRGRGQGENESEALRWSGPGPKRRAASWWGKR